MLSEEQISDIAEDFEKRHPELCDPGPAKRLVLTAEAMYGWRWIDAPEWRVRLRLQSAYWVSRRKALSDLLRASPRKPWWRRLFG